jgi:endogenous inhibitor of DNA gyrase (YacG/DUF329 family)
LAESVTATRTCPKCGEPFELNDVGRPRKFCRLCTPRKPEDIAAADERYWRVEAEKQKEHNRRLREQARSHREIINRNRAKKGLPPLGEFDETEAAS